MACLGSGGNRRCPFHWALFWPGKALAFLAHCLDFGQFLGWYHHAGKLA
jgi:hypothetical protein